MPRTVVGGAGGAGGERARAWAFPAAAWLGGVEAAGIVAVLFARGTRQAVFLSLCLLVKVPFCVGLARRSAGAWLAVVLWEATGVFAAVVAPGIPVVLRAGEVAVAGAVLVLCALCLPQFPAITLPER